MAVLVGFDALKPLLDVKQAESAYPGLTLLADSVDAAIADYLGRFLERDIYTEIVRIGSSTTQHIPLQGLPIESVESAALTIYGETETLVENEDFDIVDVGIYLHTPVRRAVATIVYFGGPDDVPVSWARAALMQTVYEWQNRDHIGAESVQTDGGFVKRPALQLLDEVKRLLAHDRHAWLRL